MLHLCNAHHTRHRGPGVAVPPGECAVHHGETGIHIERRLARMWWSTGADANCGVLGSTPKRESVVFHQAVNCVANAFSTYCG